MPSMLNDLEFENQLNELGDNQLALIKFVARQTFEGSKLLAIHETKIKTLENGDRKASGVIGGISGTIAGIIMGIISYLSNK